MERIGLLARAMVVVMELVEADEVLEIGGFGDGAVVRWRLRHSSRV